MCRSWRRYRELGIRRWVPAWRCSPCGPDGPLGRATPARPTPAPEDRHRAQGGQAMRRHDRGRPGLGATPSRPLGGNHFTLRNGALAAPSRSVYPGSVRREPRTNVGVTADGGSSWSRSMVGQPGYSVGVRLAEMGALMRSLGAVSAINLDGGGSTAHGHTVTHHGAPEGRQSAVGWASPPSHAGPGRLPVHAGGLTRLRPPVRPRHRRGACAGHFPRRLQTNASAASAWKYECRGIHLVGMRAYSRSRREG